MAQVLKLDEAIGRVAPQPRRDDLKIVRRAQPVEEPNEFWPEVSCGKQSAPENAANSQGRVLAEMLVVLGGAGFLVLLTAIVFGTPSL